MDLPSLFSRLNDTASPTPEVRMQMRKKLQKRMEPRFLMQTVHSEELSAAERAKIRQRILTRIVLPSFSHLLASLRDVLALSPEDISRIRLRFSGRLHTQRVPVFASALKWTAAFAVCVFLVRLMPFFFLTSTTRAESTVEMTPTRGVVTMTLGGITVDIRDTQAINAPSLISTGDGEATIVLHDDAVLRLAPHTTIRLHDLTDRPSTVAPGPTLTFVHGTIWVLGVLPPTVDPLSIESPEGDVVVLREGSVSLSSGTDTLLRVFDKRVTVEEGSMNQYLVAGEEIAIGQTAAVPQRMSDAVSATPWVKTNMERDAFHRREVATEETERRQQLAGILPTSLLYPAKRLAEEVDILFTVGSDARAQKRVQQADTRLSEAVALLEKGDEEEASEQMSVYRSTLLSLASGTGDNLVKFLIKQQLADATVSVASLTPEDEEYQLKEALYGVIAAVPQDTLKPRDIEGYVLVDKLGSLSRALSSSGSIRQASDLYTQIEPYVQALLEDKNTLDPELRKEALALLVSAAEGIKSMEQDLPAEQQALLAHIKEDVTQFVPEAEYEEIRLSQAQLDAVVSSIVDRIFRLRTPRARYNELFHAMEGLKGNPDRGTILRRLYHALPENGLAPHVRREIGEMRGE